LLHQLIGAGVVLAQTDSEPSSGFGSLLFFLIIGGAVYFIFFGPQRRRMKAMREEVAAVRESVEFGDEIITVGGIYGRVTSTTEHDVTIDVGGGNELRITRRAIAERVGDEPE
jgi:preprotein translocase subunit YajC